MCNVINQLGEVWWCLSIYFLVIWAVLKQNTYTTIIISIRNKWNLAVIPLKQDCGKAILQTLSSLSTGGEQNCTRHWENVLLLPLQGDLNESAIGCPIREQEICVQGWSPSPAVSDYSPAACRNPQLVSCFHTESAAELLARPTGGSTHLNGSRISKHEMQTHNQ